MYVRVSVYVYLYICMYIYVCMYHGYYSSLNSVESLLIELLGRHDLHVHDTPGGLHKVSVCLHNLPDLAGSAIRSHGQHKVTRKVGELALFDQLTDLIDLFIID